MQIATFRSFAFHSIAFISKPHFAALKKRRLKPAAMKLKRNLTDNLSDSQQQASSSSALPKENKIKKQLTLSDFNFSSSKSNSVAHTQKTEAKLGNGVWSNDSLLLASWNINGLRPTIARGDLQKYVQSAAPDILCFNEIKIDEDKFGPFSKEVQLGTQVFPGYNLYWNFCKPPIKGYSGVGVISKVAPLAVKNDLGLSHLDGEGRVISLEYDRFYLVATYVPNAGDGLKRLDFRIKEWDKHFFRHLNELKLKKPVIVAGDLNVAHQEIDITNPAANLKNPGFTLEERQSFTGLLDSGWIDTFRFLHPTTQKFTFWNMRTRAREKNQGWRIDYFLVNKECAKAVLDAQINNSVYGSDHCPVELKITLSALSRAEKQETQPE